MNVSSVFIADSWWKKIIGLVGQKKWPSGQWLYLPKCRQVHTFGMRFAIDVIFLDKDQRVVGVVESIVPWRISPYFSAAHGCLEGASGSSKILSPKIGHTINNLSFDNSSLDCKN